MKTTMAHLMKKALVMKKSKNLMLKMKSMVLVSTNGNYLIDRTKVRSSPNLVL